MCRERDGDGDTLFYWFVQTLDWSASHEGERERGGKRGSERWSEKTVFSEKREGEGEIRSSSSLSLSLFLSGLLPKAGVVCVRARLVRTRNNVNDFSLVGFIVHF